MLHVPHTKSDLDLVVAVYSSSRAGHSSVGCEVDASIHKVRDTWDVRGDPLGEIVTQGRPEVSGEKGTGV